MNPETSAMEENVINQRSDTMALAISKVMRHEEQSYDDFMGGFQYITKDGMTKSMIDKSAKETNVATQRKKLNLSTRNHKDGQKLEQLKPEPVEEDDLEEEVLDCGIKTIEKAPSNSSSRMKFDNFVEEEMSDEEPSGYVASFGRESDKGGPTPTFHCEKEHIEIAQHSTIMDTNQPSLPSDQTEGPDITSEVIVDKNRDLISPDQNKNDCSSVNSEGKNIEVLGNGDPMTLFPGEAEPQSDISEKELTNHTHLDFAVVTCQSCDVSDQTNPSITDEVLPFSLDDDFDYDNVKLTPKFTAQEVEHLKSFLPNNEVKS